MPRKSTYAKQPKNETPPTCECGCGVPVKWSGSLNRWNRFIHGHQRGRLHHRPELGETAADGKQWEYIYRTYGVTREVYNKLLEAQDGVCAICGTSDPGVGRGGKLKRFSIDHCHENGEVRGLLCFACNTGIGKLNDDPELLEVAAKYLRHPTASKMLFT